jgi:hypothetical protein
MPRFLPLAAAVLALALPLASACAQPTGLDAAGRDTGEIPDRGRPALAECQAPLPGWVWCDDFEEDRLGSYFEILNPSGSFGPADGVGLDGSRGIRARWQRGQVNAGALHLAVGRSPDGPVGYRRSVGPHDRDFRALYWRVWVRFQDGWVGDGADKLSRASLFYTPEHWGQAMAAQVWTGGAGNRHLVLDPASGTDEAGTPLAQGYNDPQRWLGAAVSEHSFLGSGAQGAWRCVEAYVRLNDPGLSNGEFRLWIDERPEAARTDLNWVGAYQGYGINAVFVENYWNAGSPAAQERYLDNFVVSTERIGCLR